MDLEQFNNQEKKNMKEFPDCTGCPKVTNDLIFLYPQKCGVDSEFAITSLQKIFDFIKDVTGLNPTGKIPDAQNYARLTIGYLKGYNQQEWYGNRGNYITLGEKGLPCCSVEK